MESLDFHEELESLIVKKQQWAEGLKHSGYFEYGDYGTGLSCTMFCRQYLSVRFSMGRRSGHSTYIRKHASKSDVVVVPFESTKRNIVPFTEAKVFSVMDLTIERINGLSGPQLIYIDVSRKISDDDISRIYTTFYNPNIWGQLFVLLG